MVELRVKFVWEGDAAPDFEVPTREEPCVFGLTTSRPGEASVNPSTLLVNGANFRDEHPIFVTGLWDGGVQDGDIKYNVRSGCAHRSVLRRRA
jgi:hypothetical protein